MSTIKISDPNLDRFYTQNYNFDILKFNLRYQAALSQLNWQDLEQPSILDLLKKYQRLLRLLLFPSWEGLGVGWFVVDWLGVG
ncbi:MAG: hypothetical protein F6J94_12775 [Moorea sp. SIO1F2]|uniref:hypothetical protein n=1 Tax=Moorena sp. SIO1F2 TaxID=2607819 RepID=UPI0013BBC2A4|nr:hypothetical protein [Moorena sp. SIO1F2]NET82765.1 hypothetical protein [Moorena sp. SIO1F2]